MKLKLLALICACFGWLAQGALAADQPAPTQDQINFFESKIRPVLVHHCYECHSSEAKVLQGGLRLDSKPGLLAGGDSGAAITQGMPLTSRLIKALRYDGLEMPPKGKLSESVIKDFETWIAMGAPDPRAAVTSTSPQRPNAIDYAAGRKHWAFQPLSNPAIPSVRNDDWPLDTLDHFILARLDEAGLRPVVDADRYTWLRRVSIDLTGLPPTVEEIDKFVRDNSPQACETVVDRLLHSREFGERWARHWLDLTGYSDMVGTSNDVFAEHAWRYREYLIQSFERDKPFDQFVRQQIAGDLLPSESVEQQSENITATGFLMVGDVEIVEPDKAKMEADHIDTQVSKIGTAFLGMTIGCARCHDHKFDPVSLVDYYGIAGILRSSPSTHKIPFGVWSMLNATDLPETPAQLEARRRLESEHAEKLAALKSDRDRLEKDKVDLNEDIAALEQPAKPGVATADVGVAGKQDSQQPPKSSEQNPAEKLAALKKSRDEITAQIKKLGAAIQHAEFFASKHPRALAMRDSKQPSDMPIYIRGNPYSPGEVVPRGALRVLDTVPFSTIPVDQSGRAQLAEWLASPLNPLTPRVAVNRIWQKLFGDGLVRTVDYFGTRGDAPSHPELLDHLATRFIQTGWSQRRLIRSIVLSRTYRMSSVNDAAALKVDPDNRLLWRMNRIRLDAEALRDGLLAVSGELKPTISGGPALVLEELENCGALVKEGVNPPNYAHRIPRAGEEFLRTIYLPVMRTNTARHDRVRSFFDFINPAQIAGQRNQTIVPTQSLFVLNSDLFRKRATALAQQLTANTPDPQRRLNQLWLRVYNRPITSTESNTASDFLAQLKSQTASANDATAWEELCHALLSSNEFLFRI